MGHGVYRGVLGGCCEGCVGECCLVNMLVLACVACVSWIWGVDFKSEEGRYLGCCCIVGIVHVVFGLCCARCWYVVSCGFIDWRLC